MNRPTLIRRCIWLAIIISALFGIDKVIAQSVSDTVVADKDHKYIENNFQKLNIQIDGISRTINDLEKKFDNDTKNMRNILNLIREEGKERSSMVFNYLLLIGTIVVGVFGLTFPYIKNAVKSAVSASFIPIKKVLGNINTKMGQFDERISGIKETMERMREDSKDVKDEVIRVRGDVRENRDLAMAIRLDMEKHLVPVQGRVEVLQDRIDEEFFQFSQRFDNFQERIEDNKKKIEDTDRIINSQDSRIRSIVDNITNNEK